jgi:hypothetical protein
VLLLDDDNVAKKIFEHLGLRAEPLPTLRAQAPPVTLELFPAASTTPPPSTTRALTEVLRPMA